MVMFATILTQIAVDVGMEFENLCFAVFTHDFDFPFSFFEFEDEEVLGILVTDDDGREKLHVIMKDEIVFFRLHYADELRMLMGDDDVDHGKKVNLYE